ncbi:hypothetical protein [Bacteroides acidifaciens]|uniref:hypothetical protein n=1 Tax=Bacteroides acidifaciens TaxID=85831 RepID=UPI00259691DB|nr:hypothetical protein [Bacteroides acidifaciens]
MRTLENCKTFGIYVMSYKRADKILTQDLFEYCTYVVREEEAEAYRASGVRNLLVIPKDCPCWNFMDTLWWTIWNTPEDVIFIADDDIKYFSYRTDKATPITKDNYRNPVLTATEEIERIGCLLSDLNLGMAYDGPQKALYCYDKEFGFKGMCGHCRWINKSGLKAKYDYKDVASSDIDMVFQELLLNRITIQPKYFLSDAGSMETNKGGVTMSRQQTIDLRLEMENKWWPYYEYDVKKNIGKINIKR